MDYHPQGKGIGSSLSPFWRFFRELKGQVATKASLSLVFLCLLWLPFSSLCRGALAVWGICCSLLLVGWLSLQYAWPGWKDVPELPSRRIWLPLIGGGVFLGIALDLYRVPPPRGIGNLVLTGFLASVTAITAYLEPRIEGLFSAHPRFGLALVLGGICLICFMLIGCNLDARWGLIDDHEIMHFLTSGSGGQVGL